MHDVVIVGGGPAGVTAALRARELGADVALVERGRMGGTCTNDGCAPTRVLAKAARLMRDSQQFETYGLLLDAPVRVDFGQMLKRTQQVIYQMHEKKQLLAHLRDVGVTMYTGTGDAHFVDAHTLQTANGERISAEKMLLCVGGAPRHLPIPGAEYVNTHSDVWTMKQLPESVVIVGSGATGCQLASIFNTFGTQTTLMDIAPRILRTEDDLIAETVTAQFGEHGMNVVTGIDGINRIEKTNDGLRMHYTEDDEDKTLTVETVIFAVGWPGNVDALRLENAGVERSGSYIQVNDSLQTSAPHIYAAGDITGRMMLVQSAGYQARVAIENAIMGTDKSAEHRLVPHGGFTDPEYAGVGLTEAQARDSHECAVAVVPYADLDRAVIDGRPVGFCKLIADKTNLRVLGAHVVGEQAVEIVQTVASGMTGRMTIMQLANLELAYPTFAAIIGLAARQLVRELDAVALVPEWRALEPRAGEWERVDH